MIGQAEEVFYVCPICLRDMCDIELHEVRPFLKTLRQSGSIKRAMVVNAWLAQSKEERSEDIGVIAAPVDFVALAAREGTSAGTLANSSALVMSAPPEGAAPGSVEMQVWRDNMTREHRLQREAAIDMSRKIRRSTEFRERDYTTPSMSGQGH